MPVAVMRQVLSQEEFTGWTRYFNHKPPDTNELQMATLSHMIASGLGSKNSKIENYIINKPSKKVKKTTSTPTGVLSTNEVQSVFAGIARRLPSGK